MTCQILTDFTSKSQAYVSVNVVGYIVGYVSNFEMINSNESSNKPILYELLEYFIREQEPELIVS